MNRAEKGERKRHSAEFRGAAGQDGKRESAELPDQHQQADGRTGASRPDRRDLQWKGEEERSERAASQGREAEERDPRLRRDDGHGEKRRARDDCTADDERPA